MNAKPISAISLLQKSTLLTMNLAKSIDLTYSCPKMCHISSSVPNAFMEAIWVCREEQANEWKREKKLLAGEKESTKKEMAMWKERIPQEWQFCSSCSMQQEWPWKESSVSEGMECGGALLEACDIGQESLRSWKLTSSWDESLANLCWTAGWQLERHHREERDKKWGNAAGERPAMREAVVPYTGPSCSCYLF